MKNNISLLPSFFFFFLRQALFFLTVIFCHYREQCWERHDPTEKKITPEVHRFQSVMDELISAEP